MHGTPSGILDWRFFFFVLPFFCAAGHLKHSVQLKQARRFLNNAIQPWSSRKSRSICTLTRAHAASKMESSCPIANRPNPHQRSRAVENSPSPSYHH
ncbi:hypothetical protein BJY00DRAFT_278522 [Aspergillus carlsbadensis]|nr:hypothetical protein BJY00DRAFT_278522 [Aspergillus carlsbadensis]